MKLNHPRPFIGALLFILICFCPCVLAEQNNYVLEFQRPADSFVGVSLSLVHALEVHSSTELEAVLLQAEILKRERGLDNLSGYSQVLLAAASSQSLSDSEKKNYYTQIALALSPTHPLIRYEVRRLQEGGTRWGNLFELIGSFWRYPSLFIPFLSSLVYPLLLALTFGMLLAGACLLIASPASILQRFSLSQPIRFVLAIIPCTILALSLGPLASLTFFAIIFAANYRWYLLGSGLLLFLWGIVVPLHENASQWEHDGRMQSVFRVVEHDQGPGEIDRVFLLSKERPEDLLVLTALLNIFGREKEYASALKVLDRIEEVTGASHWIALNRGILLFFREEWESSEEYLNEAFELRPRDVTTLFWLSKVKFQNLQTEKSRELYMTARKRDEKKVKTLEAKEAAYQDGVGWMGESFLPPLSFYLYSSRMTFPDTRRRSEAKISALFFPLFPGAMIVLGLFCIARALIPMSGLENRGFVSEDSKEARRLLAVIPGGKILSSRFALLSLPFMTTMFLVLFLALGWPKECSRFFALFPELAPVVLVFAICFVLFAYPIGWMVSRRRGEKR